MGGASEGFQGRGSSPRTGEGFSKMIATHIRVTFRGSLDSLVVGTRIRHEPPKRIRRNEERVQGNQGFSTDKTHVLNLPNHLFHIRALL